VRASHGDIKEQTIETLNEEDHVFTTIREYFCCVGAPNNMQRSNVSQEAKYCRQDKSRRSNSDEVWFGPCFDISTIPKETMNLVKEKPNIEEG
jgi:hypothetical protein